MKQWYALYVLLCSYVIVQRDVNTVQQNRGQRKSVQWFQRDILTHGKVHMGQMGKWLWCCTISFSDNSSNRTSNRDNSSSGLGDMCSGPWVHSNWGNEQMPMTMQNTPLDHSIRYNSARGARLYGSNGQTWANPYGSNGQMTPMLRNYKARQFQSTQTMEIRLAV